MQKVRISFLVVVSVLCLLIGLTPQAFAQEDGTDEFMLEEITVTAQKREENQQKVAVAMDVITGENLAELGKNNVDQILRNVANVMINTSSDGMRISLRGIADTDSTQNDQRVSGSTVSVNVDGTYNNMTSAGQNLFDLERVEVLFGPQSTMYGSNAPGGIVNVVTASPKTDKIGASATVTYGSYDLFNAQAMVNVPVVQDKVALRFAANHNQQGSVVDDTASKDKTTAGRLKALWDVNEDLSVSVTGNLSKMSNGGMMGGSVIPFVKQDDDYYPDGTKMTDPWTASDSESDTGNRDDQTTHSVSANIDWSTPYGTVSMVPSYSKSSSEGQQTDQDDEVYYQEQSNEQKGAELRMTNSADFELFKWIFGVTYYDSEQTNTKDYEDEFTLDSYSIVNQEKTALYTNITYPVWFHDQLSLVFGYRQSWDSNNSLILESNGPNAGEEAENGNPESYSKPDLKFGFEYDASDSLMFYGSYASSYRSSNAMAMPDADGNYPDPEELDSYSVGLKSRWFDNKLQVNLSAFYYDYQNRLCTDFKEATGTELDFNEDVGDQDGTDDTDGIIGTTDEDGNLIEYTIHDQNSQGTGQFTSLGVDLQTTWIITSRDRLDLSISYLDAEWKDLHFDYYYDYFGTADYAGLTPVNSPEWSATAAYEHNFVLGSYGTLTPGIDMQYKSEYVLVWNPNDNLDGCGTQEAYTLWNASVIYRPSNGNWSLNAAVKNLTDYAVKKSYMVMMGEGTLMIGDPRTYQCSFSISF